MAKPQFRLLGAMELTVDGQPVRLPGVGRGQHLTRGRVTRDYPDGSARYWCTEPTATDPSPTAPATRLVEP